MGAFNTLILNDGKQVQFKFGVRRQYEYWLGDRIEFRANQTGHIGHHEFTGIGRTNDGVFEYYRITSDNGVLTGAAQIEEREFDQLSQEELDE